MSERKYHRNEDYVGNERGHGQSSYIRTLTILDWDNTLFPTKDLSMLGPIHENIPNFCRTTWEHLHALESTVIDLLSEAMKYGKVVIISSATEKWLSGTRQMIFPRVQTFTDRHRIKIIALRDKYRGVLPYNDWKGVEFQNEVEEIFGTEDRLNILVIGDAEQEMRAARALAEDQPRSWIKTIKLAKSSPILDPATGFKIREQLVDILGNFEQRVRLKHSFHKKMELKP